MTVNMASWDRIVRFVVAVIFGYLFFTKMVSGVVGIVLLIIAIVFLLTSFVGFCPLYKVFNFSTKQ
ncbi:MAG: DUF2892 domain-containing protein [Chloroflexi bacterium]|jgi:hypothetical protein|nr:DUF2892 domain-containing protein [Chloroflexota bacterium]